MGDRSPKDPKDAPQDHAQGSDTATGGSGTTAEGPAGDLAPEGRADGGGHSPSVAGEETKRSGIVSWPVDTSSPHAEARPDPELAGPESWERLARITPDFDAGNRSSLAEDMAAFTRSKRKRRLTLLLILTILAAAVALGLRQPRGQTLIAYAKHRVADLWDTTTSGTPSAIPEDLAPESTSLMEPFTSNPLTAENALKGHHGQAVTPPQVQRGKDRTGVEPGHHPPSAHGSDLRPVVNMAVGYLYLRTVPPADVYIDGVKLPVRTPLKGYPIAKGRRRLVIKTDDGETRGPFTIIVHPGKKKYIKTIVVRKGGKKKTRS